MLEAPAVVEALAAAEPDRRTAGAALEHIRPVHSQVDNLAALAASVAVLAVGSLEAAGVVVGILVVALREVASLGVAELVVAAPVELAELLEERWPRAD